MIRPPGFRGAAFTTAEAGDVRHDAGLRREVSRALGIPSAWASLHQVHGGRVVAVSSSGEAGDGDALWSTTAQLPMAVFTADCLGVIVEADGAAGVAHAGWRGVVAGVVPALVDALSGGGHEVRRAAIGPSIGPCCFEVGDEVAGRFPDALSVTRWGTTGVDLWSAVERQLDGVPTWTSRICTRCTPGYFSYRRNRAQERLAALAWLG